MVKSSLSHRTNISRPDNSSILNLLGITGSSKKELTKPTEVLLIGLLKLLIQFESTLSKELKVKNISALRVSKEFLKSIAIIEHTLRVARKLTKRKRGKK